MLNTNFVMNMKIKVQTLFILACFDDTLKITLGKIIVSYQNDNLALMFLDEKQNCFNRQTCGFLTVNEPCVQWLKIYVAVLPIALEYNLGTLFTANLLTRTGKT